MSSGNVEANVEANVAYVTEMHTNRCRSWDYECKFPIRLRGHAAQRNKMNWEPKHSSRIK